VCENSPRARSKKTKIERVGCMYMYAGNCCCQFEFGSGCKNRTQHRMGSCSMCPLIIFGGNAVNWSAKGQTHPAEPNNKSPSGSEKLIGLDQNKSLISDGRIVFDGANLTFF
jgi:hypothetical protein